MQDKQRAKDIDAAVEHWSAQQLLCRRFGHAWDTYTAQRLPGRKGWDEVHRCVRCDSLRHQVLDKDGDITAKSYRYAEGYILDGLGRLTGVDRGVIRVRVARRRAQPADGS